jgi:hypothetical protein
MLRTFIKIWKIRICWSMPGYKKAEPHSPTFMQRKVGFWDCTFLDDYVWLGGLNNEKSGLSR